MIKAKIDLVPITFYSLPASAWHLAVIRQPVSEQDWILRAPEEIWQLELGHH